MNLKNIWKLIPLAVIVGVFLFFYFKGKNARMKFYESKVNEKIVSSNNWQKRTTEYYLENGLSIDITILDSIHLNIGDSISKEANTTEFNIYKMNKEGRYEFYKKYNTK